MIPCDAPWLIMGFDLGRRFVPLEFALLQLYGKIKLSDVYTVIVQTANKRIRRVDLVISC